MRGGLKAALVALLCAVSALPCWGLEQGTVEANKNAERDVSSEAMAELQEAVESIASDVMSGDVEGLTAAHLDSPKFSKFGPRSFERQDVASTNASEAAFFSSISDVTYRVEDLKIDLFGEVGVVTYYPQVSFVRDGERKEVSGRQTLVFLRTEEGWKIVHEHGTVRAPAAEEADAGSVDDGGAAPDG